MSYTISGIVERGAGYGKKLGFPTMNLKTETKERPKAGVYSGRATLEGEEYRAGIVVGPGEKLEAYLIGYEGDAYGKEVTLQIENFIREYKIFENEEELRQQITEDLKKC